MKIKNYAAAVSKIEKCKSLNACDKLEEAFEYQYDEDVFTTSEYLTLDGLLNEKRNEIEELN
jgi:hypothetical protein